MLFEDEHYVRIYPKLTPTTKRIGWEGRVVLHEVFLQLDRSGILPLSGETAVEAISLVTELPSELVAVGLARCLLKGCLIQVTTPDGTGALFAPKFMEAQEAKSSGALRKQVYRKRVKARNVLIDLSKSDPSPEVRRAALHAMRRAAEDGEIDDDCDLNGLIQDTESESVPARPQSGHHVPKDGHSTGHRVPKDGHAVLPADKTGHGGTNSRAVHSRAVHSRARSAQQLRAGGERRLPTDHPDNQFLDDTPIVRDQFAPPDWVRTQAHACGLTDTDIERVLDAYRRRATRIGSHPIAKHAAAFVGFLNHELDHLATTTRGDEDATNQRGSRAGISGAQPTTAPSAGTGGAGSGSEPGGNGGGGAHPRVSAAAQALLDDAAEVLASEGLPRRDPGHQSPRS